MTRRRRVEEMIEVGRRIWVRGFAAGNDGNLTVRLSEDRFLATAAGSIKGFLRPEEIVLIDRRARPVEGSRPASSEIQMHLAIYAERPDVHAVVHAHPPTATAFATAGVALDLCILPEVVATLGAIPIVPYGTPSTGELPEAMRPFIREGNACLLANHGAVTYDRDVLTAYYHLERVEHFARILLVSRQLGNVRLLTRDQVERLMAATGQPDRPVRCHVCGAVTAGVPGMTCLPDPMHSGAAAPAFPAEPARGDEPIDDALIEEIAREVRRALAGGG
jgi:L-fuculose-phosphate aldolase